MSISINAQISTPTVGTIVASVGDENVYVSLTIRRLGAVIELVTGLTIYSALSGHYEYEELSRELADDEDEAVAIASDMDFDAVEKLVSMDVTDYWRDPADFATALDNHFTAPTQADRDAYMALAIQHNAALVAAE